MGVRLGVEPQRLWACHSLRIPGVLTSKSWLPAVSGDLIPWVIECSLPSRGGGGALTF